MFDTVELRRLDRQPAAFSVRTAAICVFLCLCVHNGYGVRLPWAVSAKLVGTEPDCYETVKKKRK